MQSMTFELAIIRATASPVDTTKYPSTLAIKGECDVKVHLRPRGKSNEYLLTGSFPADS
jgi:hypothetical protein